MHEFSIVESLIRQISEQVRVQGAGRVLTVRFSRGGIFSQGALEEAFRVFSKDTPLEGAVLEVESHDHRFECPDCGHAENVTHDDLEGHAFTCPCCNTVAIVDEAHDLELLEVVVE